MSKFKKLKPDKAIKRELLAVCLFRKTWLRSLLQAISFHGHASVVLTHILIQSKSAADLQIFLSLYEDSYPLIPSWFFVLYLHVYTIE